MQFRIVTAALFGPRLQVRMFDPITLIIGFSRGQQITNHYVDACWIFANNYLLLCLAGVTLVVVLKIKFQLAIFSSNLHVVNLKKS